MAGVGKYERTPEVRKKLSDAAKLRTGERNPFFNRTHSEKSKQKISYARTGILRNASERKKQKQKKTTEWIAAHPERMRELDVKYLPQRANANRERRRERREQVISKLGGRCSSTTCRWLNADGTLGCADHRLLQVDHKNGGGTRERAKLSYDKMLLRVLENGEDYQLLCACCNWLKAHEQKEFTKKENYAHFGN